MAEICLDTEFLSIVLETIGGTIWRLEAKRDGRSIPLLRPPATDAERKPRNSGCYPLVPFGNRIAGNGFTFVGKPYSVEPNVDWDPLTLHGDGWLSEWSVMHQSATSATLRHRGEAVGSPYRYDAEQQFDLDGQGLTVTMRMVNRGPDALPFGFGWHPYFPRAADTTLTAHASTYWEEGALHLPVRELPLAEDIDFNTARRPPDRWVNNGFEGWDGRAIIDTPSLGLTTRVEASETLRRYFVFVPSPDAAPAHAERFFAFEPMSHAANGHNLPSGGGLVPLRTGESLEGTMKFAWGDFKPSNHQ